MTRVRFNTDRALFDAFPPARDHVAAEPLGKPPLDFLKLLMERQKFEDALAFCAYLLPRRDAVAWGCRSFRALMRGDTAPPPGLTRAEAWVEDPGEATRGAAFDQWNAGDKEDPSNWLALAAAWSGGPLSAGPGPSLPAPPHLTATALRVALILALHRLKLPEKAAQAGAWLADGAHLAENGL